MIDPSDQALVLRAIRNADAEQLRQIIDALSTATAGPITLPPAEPLGIIKRRRTKLAAERDADRKPPGKS